MKVIGSFRLGIDDNMTPEQIGKIVAVDHFERISARHTAVTLRTHFGRLIGFTEARGSVAYSDVSEAREADIADFPDYHTTLTFEDGHSVTIYEWETAIIFVYGEEA